VVVSLGGYNPGLPLLGMRMPGCNQYVDLGVGATIAFFPANGTASVGLAIPGAVSLNGVQIYAQSVTFTAGYNVLGMLASQGVRLVIGAF